VSIRWEIVGSSGGGAISSDGGSLLLQQVERVTGRKPAVKQATAGLSENAVLVGTLGKSPVIDRLVKEGRLDVVDVQGQWESFVIETVPDPLPGVRRGLVIAGSDRRGACQNSRPDCSCLSSRLGKGSCGSNR
jgi:hypothetical protein